MTGYMSEMRKLIGHRTIILCAASIPAHTNGCGKVHRIDERVKM